MGLSYVYYRDKMLSERGTYSVTLEMRTFLDIYGSFFHSNEKKAVHDICILYYACNLLIPHSCYMLIFNSMRYHPT